MRKVCKTWDSIARNNLFSVKINGRMFIDTTSSKLHHEVLIESFRHGYDYKITSAQKNTGEIWAWLIVATPKLTKKMEKIRFRINRRSCRSSFFSLLE